MQSQDQVDSEMIEFVLGMLHEMGHGVGTLRALADSLLRLREFKESKSSSKRLQQILDVVERLAECIRRTQFFLHSYDDLGPGPHDFLTAVVHPAVWAVLSKPNHSPGVRLVVDQSARSAAGVMLRPGPAIRGLMLLLSSPGFTKVRLKASRLKGGGINFRIDLDGPRFAHREEEVERRVTNLLETAGARVALSHSETGYSLDLKIKPAP